MTKTKCAKQSSKSSKFTRQKVPMSTQLAEEAKAYRKAKVAFRVYASIGAFDKALDELMKLNYLACWSKHPYITGDSPDGFCFSKYPGRWTQGMLKLIPTEKLINLLQNFGSQICFGNKQILEEHLRQKRHSIAYRLISEAFQSPHLIGRRPNQKTKATYIHNCLAQQHFCNQVIYFPDWSIKINWFTETLYAAFDNAPEYDNGKPINKAQLEWHFNIESTSSKTTPEGSVNAD